MKINLYPVWHGNPIDKPDFSHTRFYATQEEANECKDNLIRDWPGHTIKCEKPIVLELTKEAICNFLNKTIYVA